MTATTATTLLSDHFSLAEATASDTAARKGIDNSPPAEVIAVMERAATKLEKVRALLAAPLHINSWYRCSELNSAVGSNPTSQHLRGEAIDFIAPTFGDPLAICKAIIANKDLINFDQLILEHTWVHIGFAILNSAPKNQVLSLVANGGYATGLTDKFGKPL